MCSRKQTTRVAGLLIGSGQMMIGKQPEMASASICQRCDLLRSAFSKECLLQVVWSGRCI